MSLILVIEDDPRIQRALRRVIDVVEVADAGTGHVQHLLDIVALVTQCLGEVIELADRVDQRRVVFMQKTSDIRKRFVERARVLSR